MLPEVKRKLEEGAVMHSIVPRCTALYCTVLHNCMKSMHATSAALQACRSSLYFFLYIYIHIY
jgi:hypothetical protein